MTVIEVKVDLDIRGLIRMKMKRIGVIIISIGFSVVLSSVDLVSGIYAQDTRFLVKTDDNLREQEYYFAFTEATRFYLFGNYVQAVGLYRECLKIKPKSAAVHYQLSKIFRNSGNTAVAKMHAKYACEYESSNKWYLQELADIYQMDQKFDSAILISKKLLSLDTENINILYSIASMSERLGKYDEALSYLNTIDSKIGASKEVSVSRYRIFEAMNRKNEALHELMLAYSLSGEEYGVAGMIAEFYRNQNRADSAFKYYRKIFPEYKNDPVVIFSYADFLLELKRMDEAEIILVDAMNSDTIDNRAKTGYFYKILQAENSFNLAQPLLDTIVSIYYAKYYDDLRSMSVFSDIEFRLGNYKKTSDALKRIIVIDDSNYAAFEQLIFSENVSGNIDSVIFYSNLAISKFRDKPIPYLFNGSALFQRKDYDGAVDFLERGLALTDNTALKLEFYMLLAECYENLKDYRKSEAAFSSALDIDKENVAVRNNYAYYLAIREVDLPKAFEMSSYTIKKEPENDTYLDTFAWILYKMGKYRRAEKVILRAIKFGGEDNGEILLHYGEILFSLRKFENAATYFRKALPKFSEDKQGEILKRIKEIETKLQH